MAKLYIVNNNQTRNPGLHHEVHTTDHATELSITNAQPVGAFTNEITAVAIAKLIYADADGCAICCPLAHKG